MLTLETSSQLLVVFIDKKRTCDVETNKQVKMFIFYIEISTKEGD